MINVLEHVIQKYIRGGGGGGAIAVGGIIGACPQFTRSTTKQIIV